MLVIIRMLKICGKSISKPLKIIFKSCIRKGQFPREWKKANVVPKRVISKYHDTFNLFYYFQYM